MITKIEKFKENFGYNISKVQPKNKDELKEIIKKTIANSPKGNMCDLNFIDTSLITDMSFLFYDIDEFNGDISKWDVSNVTNMIEMFRECNFNGDISMWDVSNVKYMESMFFNNKVFNQDISEWDVSNVTDMSMMFKKSEFNQDIYNWILSDSVLNKQILLLKDKSSEFMFYESKIKRNYWPKQLQDKTKSFGIINNWNVSNVTDMSQIFKGTTSLNF